MSGSGDPKKAALTTNFGFALRHISAVVSRVGIAEGRVAEALEIT